MSDFEEDTDDYYIANYNKHDYYYDDISCRPPSGHTYLTIGQDLFSIQDYVTTQYNASIYRQLEQQNTNTVTQQEHATFEELIPATGMIYTDIQNLFGLKQPIDYGSGIEYANGILDAFPSSIPSPNIGLQIGLWLNGTKGCKDILRGRLNKKINELYEYLAYVPSSKVFLRVGYEFDNPSFGYTESPYLYRNAFRKLVTSCEKYFVKNKVPKSPSSNTLISCPDKIAFVWHSWGATKRLPIKEYYPGNRYVDWIGVSVFQQFYPWSTASNGKYSGGTIREVYDILDFATSRRVKKPIMIAESAPFGGIHLNDINDPNGKQYLLEHYNYDVDNPDDSNANNTMDIIQWDLWFQPMLDLIEKYDIGMWSYIHCNWNEQPMWSDVGFGDTRISASEYIMKKWYDNVISNPRFLFGTTQTNTYLNNCPRIASSTKSTSSPISSASKKDYQPQQQTDQERWRNDFLYLGSFLVMVLVVILLGYLHDKKQLHHGPRKADRRYRSSVVSNRSTKGRSIKKNEKPENTDNDDSNDDLGFDDDDDDDDNTNSELNDKMNESLVLDNEQNDDKNNQSYFVNTQYKSFTIEEEQEDDNDEKVPDEKTSLL